MTWGDGLASNPTAVLSPYGWKAAAMSDDGHDEYLRAEHDRRMESLADALDDLLALIDERVEDPDVVMAAARVRRLGDDFSL